VARDAAGKTELLEQTLHPKLVLWDVRVQFGVRAFQVRIGDHARAAMPRAADVDAVEIIFADQTVEMNIDEIQPGRGAPVAEQTRLDMFDL
jgi:hypothetical protein